MVSDLTQFDSETNSRLMCCAPRKWLVQGQGSSRKRLPKIGIKTGFCDKAATLDDRSADTSPQFQGGSDECTFGSSTTFVPAEMAFDYGLDCLFPRQFTLCSRSRSDWKNCRNSHRQHRRSHARRERFHHQRRNKRNQNRHEWRL